jgi:hypothetical protein
MRRKAGAGYIVFAFPLLLGGCQKALNGDSDVGKSYAIQVTFRPVIKGEPLVFGQSYTNAFGEDYNITAFRFYTSPLPLPGSYIVLPAAGDTKYRLIDAATGNTLFFTVTAQQNKLTRFSFQVGVDSIDNVSGAQAGELDPAKGMFWTWNSGYIMAKLEGLSSYSEVPDKRFTYHIGGFSGENNTIRKITLSVPENRQITLQDQRTTTIIVDADIDKWFNAAHALRIADNAFVHSPGPLAALYADNYATVFSITSITTE